MFVHVWCSISNTIDCVWLHFQMTKQSIITNFMVCRDVINLSWVFDISCQSKLKLRRKGRNKNVKSMLIKGPGKRRHIVADTLLSMMFLGLRNLGNICCGHKTFLNKIRNIFCVPDTKFVSATNVAHMGKWGNSCVGNNVSSFARALRSGMQTPSLLWLPLLKLNELLMSFGILIAIY